MADTITYNELDSETLTRDIVDLSRWSTLTIAAYYNNVAVVQHLIACGEAVGVADSGGRRPEDVAQAMDNTEVFGVLWRARFTRALDESRKLQRAYNRENNIRLFDADKNRRNREITD